MVNQHTILLVEDDDFLTNIYSTKLAMEAFNVISAGDGEEALELVRDSSIDLVLLDLGLPKLSGEEVLKSIRENPKTKDLPVVILTNFDERERVQKVLALGASDYLIKAHFVPAEVVERIKKALE